MTVEYFDGTQEFFELPEDQGFIREEYTYEPKPGDATGISKWGNRIKTFKITWAVIA